MLSAAIAAQAASVIMERNYYPETSPYTQVAFRKRWAENSGTNYLNVTVKVYVLNSDQAFLSVGGGEILAIERCNLSYASWFMLEQAKCDSEVAVKIYARGCPAKWSAQ